MERGSFQFSTGKNIRSSLLLLQLGSTTHSWSLPKDYVNPLDSVTTQSNKDLDYLDILHNTMLTHCIIDIMLIVDGGAGRS